MAIVGPEASGFMPEWLAESILFDDRTDAGKRLSCGLKAEFSAPLVVGLTLGGVEIGNEVARPLRAPLDVAVVARIHHPAEPEYTIGAVAPGGACHVVDRKGLSEAQLVVATSRARKEAGLLEARLHPHRHPAVLAGRDVLLVDEAIMTGATMLAAIAWARAAHAARVIAAVPVGSLAGLGLVREAADLVFCLFEFAYLGSRGVWFGDFPVLEDEDIVRLLEASR
jgi:putative phosphoribosyl transferase